jgi:hypothetical protein
LSASTSRRYTFSISPESGTDASLTLRVRDRLLGSSFEGADLTFQLDHYVPLKRLFGEHHVLALSLRGGAGVGDTRVARFFSVGGLPQQDVFGALTLLTPSFVGGGFLRGFPVGFTFGDHFGIANIEYRYPITRIERGLGSLPFYVRKLHGRLFTDYGAAFLGAPTLAALAPRGATEEGLMRAGVGAELLADVTIGYFIGTTVRLGAARGLGEGGLTDFYLLVGAPF